MKKWLGFALNAFYLNIFEKHTSSLITTAKVTTKHNNTVTMAACITDFTCVNGYVDQKCIN